jgi:hypothetical protein
MQVLIGFVGTAYLMIILLVGYYILAFQPELEPFRMEGDLSSITARPNPVDKFFLASIRKWLFACRNDLVKFSYLEKYFNKVYSFKPITIHGMILI